jgi:fructosamine-3-kinase
VRIAGKPCFLKTNTAAFADAFAAEADGLAALAASGLPVPSPIRHGGEGATAFLLLELLELRSSGDSAALGRSLAALHARPGAQFGWTRDNFIGATPQANAWHENWAEFFRRRRIEPQLALAHSNGFDLEPPNVEAILAGHDPQPALLHGDLWSGNVGFVDAGPVFFDPAVYYGDREADLAMTELFGGFPKAFYAAYEAALPLRTGYETRKHLYNLYHLLNHLNLFGGGYLAQVRATLRLLREALQ